MKCPKCNYLGFETGDRCRNCGYDFSLLTVADAAPHDYDIHPAAVDDVPVHVVDDMNAQNHGSEDRHDSPGGAQGFEPTLRDSIDDPIDEPLAIAVTPETPFEEDARVAPRPDVAPATTAAPAAPGDSDLPLFTPAEQDDDEPLIKLPAAPRPPLAVRRTPSDARAGRPEHASRGTLDSSRLRAVARPSSPPIAAPVLRFSEEVPEPSAPLEETQADPGERVPSRRITDQPSRPGARFVAMLIDHGILLGIDVAVVYFTARMAGLAVNEWRFLPAAPLLAFLGLLKVAYFYAFTAVGGQTIGKMAVGTCVVGDNGRPIDAARAMRRTSAGIVSVLLLGLGWVPALFGDHRALHDRLAGTRVVRLRSV